MKKLRTLIEEVLLEYGFYEDAAAYMSDIVAHTIIQKSDTIKEISDLKTEILLLAEKSKGAKS